jgi:hypothetical protein
VTPEIARRHEKEVVCEAHSIEDGVKSAIE